MEQSLTLRNIFVFIIALLIACIIAICTYQAMTFTEPIAKPLAIPKDDAIPHPNSNQNIEPHIVYEIFFVSPVDAHETLKYGISSQLNYKTKDGNPRPELQCNYFQKMPQYAGGKVCYIILQQAVAGRIAAKAIELGLINLYVARNKRMPPQQKLPLPVNL